MCVCVFKLGSFSFVCLGMAVTEQTYWIVFERVTTVTVRCSDVNCKLLVGLNGLLATCSKST